LKSEKKQWAWRLGIYFVGMVILYSGVSMAVQAQLGVSSSLSLPYSIAMASGIDLSVMVIIVYGLEVAAQFVIRKKRQVRDLLQIPIALFLSLVLDRFEALGLFRYELLWQRALLMLISNIFIGIGVFMMVTMRLIPGPPEGLLDSLAQRTGLDLGLMKNIQDGFMVGSAIVIDLVFRRCVDTVGIGTVCSMILVGRVVALCNKLFLKKVLALTGLPPVVQAEKKPLR